MDNIKQIIDNQTAKIRVEWHDKPENYSKEAKTKIKNKIVNKYNLNKNNVSVLFKPIILDTVGNVIRLNNIGVENIMDVNYQRQLMKELINRDNIDIDIESIIALDTKVNNLLPIDIGLSQHKQYKIKSLYIDNFLSFGSDNTISYSDINGLIVVNSIPENQGGKSTLTIDAIKFLLYGSTTKTDKNELVFNTYTDKNKLIVKGCIEIDGEEFIIERNLERKPKKAGGWNITNKVSFSQRLPNGQELLLNEEDARFTSTKIKETIGSESDFELLVLATERNLDDLIGLTTTESGRVLTRLVGLEILEMKENIIRKLYNEFDSKKKSNIYDLVTLEQEIINHNKLISDSEELNKSNNKLLEDTKKKIQLLNDENDSLLNTKEKIDVSLINLNPDVLNTEIAEITKKGLLIKDKQKDIIDKLKLLDNCFFDEDKYHQLTTDLNKLISDQIVKKKDIAKNDELIAKLISDGICFACNRKLDTIDNSQHIEKYKLENSNNIIQLDDITNNIDKLNNQINQLKLDKIKFDNKNKYELERDRYDVELSALRNDLKSKQNDLKQLNLNLVAIKHNENIDIVLTRNKTELSVLNKTKDNLFIEIERTNSIITQNKTHITNKLELISLIKEEEKQDRLYKIYISLIGKKGIGKLVLKSLLPIINSELDELLDGVCDFSIEVSVDDKNDIYFLMEKDNIIKSLKSGSGFEKTAASIALRAVLGKVSTLPMPNFITFDEALGKVANQNMDNIKLLFDKIKNMYDIVFLITHNDQIKDWGDKLITIKKENNISSVIINNN